MLTTAAVLVGLLPVPAAAASAAGAPEVPHGVMSIRHLPNGDTEYASYSPAPGVSDKELFDHLQKQGVTGLIDPGQRQDVGVMAGACHYGTAYALDDGKCPAAAWEKKGRTRPLVHFNDHSGTKWKVSTGAGKWNQSVRIDVQSAWNSCPLTVGIHCVDVQSYDFGNTVQGGTTYWTLTALRYFVEGSVYVRFNDRISSTSNVYDMIVCHEFGHAIGLGHSTDYYRSCMWADYHAGLPNPSNDDYNLLYYVSYPG